MNNLLLINLLTYYLIPTTYYLAYLINKQI
jgi:hypothetical protein